MAHRFMSWKVIILIIVIIIKIIDPESNDMYRVIPKSVSQIIIRLNLNIYVYMQGVSRL